MIGVLAGREQDTQRYTQENAMEAETGAIYL